MSTPVAAPDGGDGGDGGDTGLAADSGPIVPAKASLSGTAIEFGGSDCGGAAPASKTFTVTNGGGAPLTWSATLEKNDFFSLAGSTGGTLTGGAAGTISVAAKAVASSATAGSQLSATLIITTSDPTLPSTSVPITMTANGATFTLVPGDADFGLQPVGTQAPDLALVLTNTGNTAAQVSFAASANGDFAVEWTGSPNAAAVAPGGTLAGLKARFKATNITASSNVVPIKVTGAGICGVSAQAVTVKGQGTNGAFSYSPGTVDLGLTDCGSAALDQTFVVANTGNTQLSWSAALALGFSSPYTLVPQGGLLLPQTSTTVTVHSKPIPVPSEVTANLYGDTATITTNASGDVPHVLVIKQTARGAILTTNTATLDYQTFNYGALLPFTVNNLGNAPAHVEVSASSLTVVSPSTLPVTLPGAANQLFSVSATPSVLGTLGGTLDVWTSGNTVLCKPLPPQIKAKGSVSAGTIVSTSADRLSGCATSATKHAFCWGYIAQRYGHDSRVMVMDAIGLSDSARVVTNDNYGVTCNVTTAGAVTCSGNQYQDGTVIQNLSSGVTQLVEGWDQDFFCALKADAVLCFHMNNPVAQPVVASGIKSIAAGGGYRGGLAAVKSSDGSVLMGYPWSLTPHPTLVGVTQMAMGSSHACALMADTSVQCTGQDYYNQRGDGQMNGGDNYPSMTTVQDVDATPLTGATQIALGNESTCVRKAGGAVVCFGRNYEGEMGNGTQGGPSSSTLAVDASNLTQATGIVSGYYHTYATQNGGGLFAWGHNGQGQTAISSGGNVLSPALLGL